MLKRRIAIITIFTIAVSAMAQSNYDKYINAAKKGDAEAQYQIGYYYTMKGKTKDAIPWIIKASEQNHSSAIVVLWMYYYEGGNGTEKDVIKTLDLLKKTAEGGAAQSQCQLGKIYLTGAKNKKGDIILSKNEELAIQLFQKSIAQGYPSACIELGSYYYNQKDYDKAILTYLKNPDKEKGIPAYSLGLAYEAKGDYNQALYWYQKCSDSGPYPAQMSNPKIKQLRVKMQQDNIASNSDTQLNTIKPQIQQPTQSKQEVVGVDAVDMGIPTSGRVNRNTFAIIIANEDYQNETKVDYAKNDGEVFKAYCNKTLGLPEKNIHFVANATLNNLIGELDWLQQVCDAYGGDASVIFYYAGHGIPDEASGASYLIPIDGNSRILRTCFSTNELYESFGKLPAKIVTVLMDACFSGAVRSGGMLAAARGVAIKAKASAPKGNMIVFTAAQGEETAYKYDEAKHGLFTYFLLKKLKDSRGDVTFGELSRYITEQVKRISIVENGKKQTPSVMTSIKLKPIWESMKFD